MCRRLTTRCTRHLTQTALRCRSRRFASSAGELRRYVSVRSFCILFLSVSISGCATPRAYSGIVLNCYDEPVSNIPVTAFRNGWIPLTLPPVVGRGVSRDDGTFSITTDDQADFIGVVSRDEAVKVILNDVDKLSIDYCSASDIQPSH